MAAVAAVREAKGGWQAHMTYLERRFPVRWRQMDGIKHAGGRRGEEHETFEKAIDRIHRENELTTARAQASTDAGGARRILDQ
ncbi:MAG TPA: hypothetical protein VE777_03695 [Gaiellales bacterium]|jgi:hypothetical protein|nr:hypothetical protein [Gaiellales bacterium]